MTARLFIVAFATAVAAGPISAQSPGAPSGSGARTNPPAGGAASAQNSYNGRAGQLDVQVPKVQADFKIDGHLDEEAWSGASMLTGFSQFEPVDRQPADDSTEVLVLYTDYAIYFGIRAFERHGTVVATLADRDKIGSNDHIQLILDTFNDRRRALVFSANPLGVQADGTLTDGQHGADLSPDFIFESKGRVTPDGYEIEVRIPFKNIRYQQTDIQQWGVQVLRRVTHSGHIQSWTPAERGAPSFLTQSGTFTGLTGLKRGLVLEANPVMTAVSRGGPRSTTDRSWQYRRDDPEFGGTVRWGVTPNMSLNATANPDFSQVESDVGQTIYDPRQAISFPEKRPFFLEANENFQVPNSLIYTRRIVSPKAAAKLSGKLGGMNVGVLSAIDDAATASPGRVDPAYNLLRLRRDVGPQSNVGLVYTDRMQGADYSRVLGFDSRLLLGKRHVLNSQVAGNLSSAAGSSANGGPLFDFTLTRTGRETGFNLVFEGIHPEFEAASGFLPRTGIARAVFIPRRTWFPKSSVFESIQFTPIFDNTWEWDRFVEGTEPNDIKVNTQTTARLRGGWNATVYTWTETFKYPTSLYTNYYVERRLANGTVRDTVPFTGTDRLTNFGVDLRLGTPQWKTFAASGNLTAGQDDNFDEWSSALILYSTVEADWRPTGKVRVNGRWLEQRVYRKTDRSLVRLRSIPRVKLEYQVSRPIFVRFVGQYDGLKVDALRDDSRTESPILIRTATGYRPAAPVNRGGLRTDWLFSYQPSPGTVMFMGYGASLGSEQFRPTDLERTSDGFFVKLSYLFRM
ncbi:MAG: DUF5916 domain-containing protein [Gemmatimonadetes bacterium]|nr:DUF5916 domain-containing protein [Gemmatimonadota bacterium]